MTDWLEVAVSCASALPDCNNATEQLEAWLFAAGALSVTFRDEQRDADLSHAVLEPAPGEMRLWDDVTLIGLFDQTCEADAVHTALALAARAAGLALPAYRLTVLADTAWERTWMEDFRCMQFGARLWICPSSESVVDDDAVNLRLDPGLAFGTGTHATTAQCLQWLGQGTDATLSPFAGQTVIDYGCGSGVLAIAAAMLGAKQVVAVDIDEQALLATRRNADANGVLDKLLIVHADAASLPLCDVLIANILYQPLLQLADRITAQVVAGGQLVMAGMLVDQMASLRLRYTPAFVFDADRSHDGWALMTAVRQSTH